MLTLRKRQLQQQHKNLIGWQGEEAAKKFLLKNNYRILAQRWRAGREEIDLVAFDQNNQELVFVEVKTRSRDDLVAPELALNERKLAAFHRAAWAFLQESQLKYDYRFDLITVLPQKICHYENISWP